MNKNKLVFANWKMNLHSEDVIMLVKSVVDKINNISGVDVVLAPSFPYLGIVKNLTKNSKISLSAQNVFWEESGPYTGEVSPEMLLDVGCTWTMIGHSERRQHLLETNEMINLAKKTSEKTILEMTDKLHQSIENKKKNVEQKIVQMKESALKDIKNTSVKISIEAVEHIIKNSVDKKKLDKLYLKNIEQTKSALKNTIV